MTLNHCNSTVDACRFQPICLKDIEEGQGPAVHVALIDKSMQSPSSTAYCHPLLNESLISVLSSLHPFAANHFLQVIRPSRRWESYYVFVISVSTLTLVSSMDNQSTNGAYDAGCFPSR